MRLSFHQRAGPGRTSAGWNAGQVWEYKTALALVVWLSAGGFCHLHVPPGKVSLGGVLEEEKVREASSLALCIGNLSLVSSPSVNSGICWHLLELPLLLLPQDTSVVSEVFGECSYPSLAVRGCVVWVICTKDTHSVQGMSGLACSIPGGSGFLKYTAPLI